MAYAKMRSIRINAQVGRAEQRLFTLHHDIQVKQEVCMRVGKHKNDKKMKNYQLGLLIELQWLKEEYDELQKKIFKLHAEAANLPVTAATDPSYF